MVWVALLYAIVGTWLTDRVGRPLVRLNFDQQRYEADFRFGLVAQRGAHHVQLLTIESRHRPDRPGEVTAIRVDVQSRRPPCKRPGEAVLAEAQQTERKGHDEGALRQLEQADDREHRVSRTGHGEDVPPLTTPGQTAPVGGVDPSGEVAERSPVVRREVPARASPEQKGRREHEGQDQSHTGRQGYRY